MKWDNINQLCDVVRETSFAIVRQERGLLINFGAVKLYVKKYLMTPGG